MTRTLILMAALGLVACSGDEKDTETPEETDTTPTPEPTGDTGVALEFTPAAFGVGIADFAIDASGNAVGYTGFDQAGNTVQGAVTIIVTLLDQSATTGSPITAANSCQIAYSVPGPVAPAPWATEAGIYWGITIPAGTAVAANSCDPDTFTFPATWSDPAAAVSQWDWGFGLNVMDPAVESQLSAQAGAQWASISGNVVGAGWYSSLLAGNASTPGGYVNGGYAIATQVDANFQWQVDGAGNPVLLTSNEIWEPNVSTLPGVGSYQGSGVQYLQPADLLLQPAP